MKVELNNTGRFVLTAENEQDNTMLFAVINTPTLNGIRFTFPKGAVKIQAAKLTELSGTPKQKRGYKKQYLKNCIVEGCNEKHKFLGLHMYKAHGIDKDGKQHETYPYKDKRFAVTKPVVKLGNGTYKVRTESKPGFLS
jgi:hypothetical protein